MGLSIPPRMINHYQNCYQNFQNGFLGVSGSGVDDTGKAGTIFPVKEIFSGPMKA
jgi:hypothetical protein